jgi:hypothetical protein
LNFSGLGKGFASVEGDTMQIIKTLLLVAAFALTSIEGYASIGRPKEATEWRRDVGYVAEQAPKVHKNLFHSDNDLAIQSYRKSLELNLL